MAVDDRDDGLLRRVREIDDLLRVLGMPAGVEDDEAIRRREHDRIAVRLRAGDDTAKQVPWRAELALIDAGPKLYPDERITETSTRTIAGRQFRVGLESHAVTAGEVWLFDPASRVLASGDLVTLPAPLFDTACAERWKSAIDRLGGIDFKVLVPGHGATMGRADLATYRRAFDRLLECATSKSPKQACVDGWMHDAAALIPADDEKLARSLLDYYIDGNLRGDAAQKTKLCGA